MAIPEHHADQGASGSYHAFISYSSHDRRAAQRLQRFLESYRVGAAKKRVRVYLDSTDIRGGELSEELHQALSRSEHLIVCWSPAAADSRWVRAEIDQFRELHGTANIAIAVLRGPQVPAQVDPLADVECRQHDLRRGWLLGLALPETQIESLRLLTFVTGVGLRTLRNWHLRRMALLVTASLLLAVVPPTAVLSYPVDEWLRVPLVLPRQMPSGPSHDRELHPVACEAQDGQVWVAWRFKGLRPQGYASYLFETKNVLDPNQTPRQSDRYRLQS